MSLLPFIWPTWSLNRAELVYAICRVLGVREPETPKEAAA
jgi:hypothetical protein